MSKADNTQAVLYITYLGLLEPIPQAQVVPYLISLAENVKIYLLSFEKASLLREKPALFKKTQELLKQRGIRWFRLRYHKRPKIVSSLYDILAGMFLALYLIIRYRIKIIHARSDLPAVIGFMLKSMLSIRLLYDRRGIMGTDHTEHSQWKKRGLLYKLSLWFEKKVIRQSEATVVLTDWMNDHLRKNVLSDLTAGERLIKTIPCCIDLHLFRYTQVQDESLKERFALKDRFVFLYAGSLGTYNLLDEMLDFFKIARRHIPQAHFLILSHTSASIIVQACQRKGIRPEAVTVTFAPREELPSLLSLADAGVVFRRFSETARAASPTKFAEYLACGLPVLCGPRIGDLDKIITERKIGIVLDNYGFKEYQRGTQRLISLIKEDRGLRARCRAVAKELFSLERGIRSYRDIYHRLMR